MLRIRPDFLLVFVLFVVPYSLAQNPSNAVVSSGVQISNQSHILGQPLAFEANRGQAPAGVDFVARGQGYSAQLKANRVILGVSRPANNASGEKTRSENEVVEIDLAGGNGSHFCQPAHRQYQRRAVYHPNQFRLAGCADHASSSERGLQ